MLRLRWQPASPSLGKWSSPRVLGVAGWDHAWEANGSASVIGGSTVKLLHVAAQMMDPVSLLLQLLLSSCVLGLELEMGAVREHPRLL